MSGLKLDLDFMHALQQNLILPFTVAPSTKLLGQALTALAGKMLPQMRVEAISLLIDGYPAVEDIRLFDWRVLTGESGRTVKSTPARFNIEDKIINLHLEGDSERRGLLIKLSLSLELIEEIKETTTDIVMHHCENFTTLIQPFVKAAMSALSSNSLLSPKQEHLPRVIAKVVMQRKYGHIYNFFMRLKEHQVNKVPIFTRLRSYHNIVRRCYDSWGIEERIGYDEDAKREYLTRICALQTFTRAFQIFERTCLNTKAEFFFRFRNEIVD